MKLEFKGIVSIGDSSRVSDDEDCDGAIHIGDDDLVDEIHEKAWKPDVRAILNGDVVATGSLVSELGWGYSEYTPMEDDVAKVGDKDLIEILRAHDGKIVSLIVTDE